LFLFFGLIIRKRIEPAPTTNETNTEDNHPPTIPS
jgi:hypothetical protein